MDNDFIRVSLRLRSKASQGVNYSHEISAPEKYGLFNFSFVTREMLYSFLFVFKLSCYSSLQLQIVVISADSFNKQKGKGFFDLFM